MDLLKQLTGKNPSEYEAAAKQLVDNADTVLFEKLVKQDDFLYDFIKENVAKRIQQACNETNYKNVLSFLNYYSPFYDTVLAEVLFSYSNNSLLPDIKELFYNGTNEQKAYAVKYLSFVPPKLFTDLIFKLREYAENSYEPLALNSIELLSLIGDCELKNKALEKLKSQDDFLRYEGVKFLVTYQAKDTLKEIISVMKKSTLAENIAAEIPYLADLSEILDTDFDDTILVICNIVNAIPEIVPFKAINDYNLEYIIDKITSIDLTSTSAVLIKLVKDKFTEFVNNEEYLYDCDLNTKKTINNIFEKVKNISDNKLESLIYEELYEESDFVLFAIDYVNEVQELETLLESDNSTIIMKVLTVLKEKNMLSTVHKNIAISHMNNENIKKMAEVL